MNTFHRNVLATIRHKVQRIVSEWMFKLRPFNQQTCNQNSFFSRFEHLNVVLQCLIFLFASLNKQPNNRNFKFSPFSRPQMANMNRLIFFPRLFSSLLFFIPNVIQTVACLNSSGCSKVHFIALFIDRTQIETSETKNNRNT